MTFDEDKRIYFVSETEGGDGVHDDHMQGSQKQKILAARKHFETINVPYATPASSLRSAIEKL